MEEKRVTAMSFEDDDDFSENAKNPASVQNQHKPDMAQTPPAANKSNTQLTSDPAKNPVQPGNQQISKSAPTSATGTFPKSSSKNAVSTSPKNDPKDQEQKKTRKPRKTKVQIIKDIEEQEEKILKKLAQLGERKKKLSLTPEQKREEKRKAQTHCKIVAGAIAFDLYEKGEKFFTLENFKNSVESQITKPLEIAFIDKIFKQKK